MFKDYNPANWTIDWSMVAFTTAELVLAVALAWLVYRVLFGIVDRVTRMSESQSGDIVIDSIRRPVKWSLIAIAITLVAQSDPHLAGVWEPIGRFVRPALLGWIAYTLVKALTVVLELRLESSDDPVAARSRRTRIAILSRTATFVIVFITVGLMLFAIPSVQAIGTTLLASAGLAALAVGAAAQPALKSLIAGLQMAITEPLRIGDLVVIDGHTGRVDEIRMSFVIVRTWDERAVVVPTNRFLDNTFENWSRRNEMLSGPVFLHLDPGTDIAPIRAEFLRFLATQELWDGRTARALMTEARTDNIELRLAMSARTISDLFDLRCAVREHMLDWLREHVPDALIHRGATVPVALTS